jgi:hypothetical protein
VVWTSTVLPASDPFLNPASGGALWATGYGGHFAFPLPPDFSDKRRQAVYLDSQGQSLFTDAEDGWTPGGVLVDGAGNGILVRDQNQKEGEPLIQFGEVRKLATDGSVAWTVPIEYGWGRVGATVGPSGDVYLATIIKDDRTIYPAATEKIDDMTFEGPIIAVLRFAP